MSANSYNDFQDGAPTMSFKQGPRDWRFFDDFNTFNPSASATSFTGTGGWSYFSTDSGNTAACDNTNSGGVLKLAFSSPTDEDVIMVQGHGGIIPTSFCQPGTPIRWGTRFKFDDVDSADLHIGLSIFDNSMAAGAPADWVGLRLLAAEASGAVTVISQKDSVNQTATGVLTMANDTWCRAFFEFWPVTGNSDSGALYYEFHHNGVVAAGTIPLVNTFPDDVWIAPMIQYQIEGTDGDALYMDWFYMHAIRADYVPGTG